MDVYFSDFGFLSGVLLVLVNCQMLAANVLYIAAQIMSLYCHMFQEAQARTSQAIAEALVLDKKEKQGGEKTKLPA